MLGFSAAIFARICWRSPRFLDIDGAAPPGACSTPTITIHRLHFTICIAYVRVCKQFGPSLAVRPTSNALQMQLVCSPSALRFPFLLMLCGLSIIHFCYLEVSPGHSGQGSFMSMVSSAYQFLSLSASSGSAPIALPDEHDLSSWISVVLPRFPAAPLRENTSLRIGILGS